MFFRLIFAYAEFFGRVITKADPRAGIIVAGSNGTFDPGFKDFVLFRRAHATQDQHFASPEHVTYRFYRPADRRIVASAKIDSAINLAVRLKEFRLDHFAGFDVL